MSDEKCECPAKAALQKVLAEDKYGLYDKEIKEAISAPCPLQAEYENVLVDRNELLASHIAVTAENLRLDAEVERLRAKLEEKEQCVNGGLSTLVLLATLSGLKAENAALKTRAWCDVCVGMGTLESGRPCLCGGTGQVQDALTEMRRLYVAEESVVDRLTVELADLQREYRVLSDDSEAVQAELVAARQALGPFQRYITARLEIFGANSLHSYPEMAVCERTAIGKVAAGIYREDWGRAAALAGKPEDGQ